MLVKIEKFSKKTNKSVYNLFHHNFAFQNKSKCYCESVKTDQKTIFQTNFRSSRLFCQGYVDLFFA